MSGDQGKYSAETCPGCSSDGLVIEAVTSTASLGALLGVLRQRDYSKKFLATIFDDRDKSIYPHDLLVAMMPKKRGGQRSVGILRRSLKRDKERGCCVIIDFVWILPEFRGLSLGRRLLMSGLHMGRSIKPVKLSVAGFEENVRAVRLYESIGFVWTDHTKTEMVLELEALAALTGPANVPEPATRESAEPTSVVGSATSVAVIGSLQHDGKTSSRTSLRALREVRCTNSPRQSNVEEVDDTPDVDLKARLVERLQTEQDWIVG